YHFFLGDGLAGNSMIRSRLAAKVPLFTTYMYRDLGTNQVSSIPAFLALFYVPLLL
ncbi:hypothetical protein LZ30DRAFT_603737, partial [Colletotrichum cereale]